MGVARWQPVPVGWARTVSSSCDSMGFRGCDPSVARADSARSLWPTRGRVVVTPEVGIADAYAPWAQAPGRHYPLNRSVDRPRVGSSPVGVGSSPVGSSLRRIAPRPLLLPSPTSSASPISTLGRIRPQGVTESKRSGLDAPSALEVVDRGIRVHGLDVVSAVFGMRGARNLARTLLMESSDTCRRGPTGVGMTTNRRQTWRRNQDRPRTSGPGGCIGRILRATPIHGGPFDAAFRPATPGRS